MPEVTHIEVGSATVRLISDGDRIVAGMRKGHVFEPDSLAAWAAFCAGGGTVLDIGAYTGLYSVGARLLGAHAIPFEPMPFNRARFVENAKVNGVSGKINSEAISDRVGKAIIRFNPKMAFTSGASLFRTAGQQLRVDSITIDSLNLASVDAIKIDVERAEPLVLAGARETLGRCRPPMLVEVLGEAEGEAVLAAVEGYRVEATLDRRNWLMLPCGSC